MGLHGNTKVEFLDGGVSDHSASVITVGKLKSFGPCLFKYFTYCSDNAEFLNWVTEGWSMEVEGVPTYRLYAILASGWGFSQSIWASCDI